MPEATILVVLYCSRKSYVSLDEGEGGAIETADYGIVSTGWLISSIY